jgi:adenylate cyclase
MPPVRRLTAILAADVAGYSRLMGTDEEGTHERLRGHLRDLIEPKIAEHRGRVVKNTGDGLLAEFQSVVDAVRCAVEVQRGIAERNGATPPAERVEFRVGINLGDVIAEEHDIFGDGVNVAARLEALAEPGGICLSRVVRDQVRDKLDFVFEDLGEQEVKNIARPVRVYRVREAGIAAKSPSPPGQSGPPLPDKPSIAVLPFANMSGDPEQEYFADGMVEEIIFSNRYFSDVLYPSLLPEFQRFTRLILAHRRLCSSGVFWAQLHRNYTRSRAPLRLPHQWARHPGRSGQDRVEPLGARLRSSGR